MKRILICGGNGLLGQRLSLLLSTQTEFEVLSTSHHRSYVFDSRLFDYTQLDITRKGDAKSLISSFQPDVIFNAAAATNVDWCESHRDEAWKVNVVGVENLIEGARKVGAKFIHVSTDYVFDGKHGPYKEDDPPNPISYYGKTKLAGENAIRISDIPYALVRTIVVYGNMIGKRGNFALWVINNLRSGQKIRCAEDQVSNPTYVGDLACALIRIFELNRGGIYHICGAEHLSRYHFAKRIADIFGLDGGLIQSVKTSELNQQAPRPLVSGFLTSKAEEELGWKPMDTTRGLTMLKQELQAERRN
ncbi:MAG: dTDP-4-dehydrorhamnose reductase [Ignavibacteriales bacterium]|nr:dTDP-4-dehydrorhamnose reductase [Ignavibacteriales bacterium]